MHPTHRGYEDMDDYRHKQFRYGIAFVSITAVCFACSLLAAPEPDLALYLAGWTIALCCVAIAWLKPVLWLLGPFGALAGAVLIRVASDGADAGLGPLLLIPILAVSVYGSRQALIVTVGLVIATVLAFQVLGAEGQIDLTPAWRQDVLLAVLATVLGFVTQDLVTRMRTERNLAEERGRIIEELALTDPLTGIDNRRGWERMIRRSVGLSRRLSQPLSLAMLDLDRFKQYNDDHGHQAGDDFLRQVALNWEEMTRIEDHIARYGGEEFVVTLPNTGLSAARTIIERLRAGLPLPEHETDSPITCSAGIAEWDGSETVRELVARADRALYRAKKAGRDQTVTDEDLDGKPSNDSRGS